MRHSLASVLYWGAGLCVSPHPAALNRHFQPHLALLTTSVSKLSPLTAKFHLPRVYFLHRSHTLLLFGTTLFKPSFPSHAIASELYVLEIIHPDSVHPFPISTSAQSPAPVKQPLGNHITLTVPSGPQERNHATPSPVIWASFIMSPSLREWRPHHLPMVRCPAFALEMPSSPHIKSLTKCCYYLYSSLPRVGCCTPSSQLL